MIQSVLIHDREVPNDLFHEDLHLHRVRLSSEDMSTEEAKSALLDVMKNPNVDVAIISVGTQLQSALRSALSQLNRDKHLMTVFIIDSPPSLYAFAFEPHNYTIFEGIFLPSALNKPSDSIFYYSGPKKSLDCQEAIPAEGVFRKPLNMGPSFGTAAVLQALCRALRGAEDFGLKYVMKATHFLDIEPLTMRDILRSASARSTISMQQEKDHVSSDIRDLTDDLRDFLHLSTSIDYPAPFMESISSIMEEWQGSHSEAYRPSSINAHSPAILSSNKPNRMQLDHVLVVGLGIMGLGMAMSLSKSLQVTGCDVNSERLNEATSKSLSTCQDVASCLDKVDCVLFVLEKSEQVLETIKAMSGQLESRRKPLTIMTHTTMSASSAVEIEERILRLNDNISYLEAPVSGGPAKAEKGQLLVILGGNRDVADQKLPILQQMCGTIYYAGKVGNASKMKALHQISAAINHVSVFEVACLGLRCGIDSQVLYDVLASHAYNQYLVDRLPKFLDQDLSPDARLSIWVKDLKIAREQLSETGLSTSILDTLLFLIEQAGQKGSMLDSDICVARFWQGM